MCLRNVSLAVVIPAAERGWTEHLLAPEADSAPSFSFLSSILGWSLPEAPRGRGALATQRGCPTAFQSHSQPVFLFVVSCLPPLPQSWWFQFLSISYVCREDLNTCFQYAVGKHLSFIFLCPAKVRFHFFLIHHPSFVYGFKVSSETEFELIFLILPVLGGWFPETHCKVQGFYSAILNPEVMTFQCCLLIPNTEIIILPCGNSQTLSLITFWKCDIRDLYGILSW